MTKRVDILLATYQGAFYVQEQIFSILNQTHSNLHLWIRDDGSSDQTLEYLHQFSTQYPEKISIIPSRKNFGIQGNFSELMRHTEAPYIMFADQDDVWLPHKVELSLDAMKQLENRYGMQKPLLVHSDLKVVHSDLSVIHPSFWRYTGLNPHSTTLNRLLTQNALTGCTFLMNRPLLNVSIPIPSQAIMHDWWVGLVASAFGHIAHVPFATILYRQHHRNDTGAKKYGIQNAFKSTDFSKRTYRQAQQFLEFYASQLDYQKREIVKAYTSLEELSYLSQKMQIINFQFFKHGLLRNLCWLLERK